MQIQITVNITKNKLKQLAAKIEPVMFNKLAKATLRGLEKARNYTKRRLTGEVLHVQTGRLRNSIAIDVERNGSKIIGAMGTNVVYGKFWELGFTVPAYTIVPREKRALHFFIGSKEIFAKSVQMPARTVKARPFLKPSLLEAVPDFEQYWAQAANKAIQEVIR